MLKSRLILGLATLTLSGLALAVSSVSTAQAPMVEATKEHKLLQSGIGSYEGTLSMPMPGADAPMAAPCTEVVTGLGDMWTTSLFEMDFMGMPFSGSSTLGYDPAKGKYVGTWIDSMTTTLTIMEGEYDEAKGAIVMHYDMADETGEMRPVRSENKQTKDGYTMEFISLKDGKESPIMTITMKRKAAEGEHSDK